MRVGVIGLTDAAEYSFMKSLSDERKVEPLEAGCVSKAFAEEAVLW